MNYFKGYIYYTQTISHNPKNNRKITNSNFKIVTSIHSFNCFIGLYLKEFVCNKYSLYFKDLIFVAQNITSMPGPERFRLNRTWAWLPNL